MKTIKEWFEELPEPIRSKAIEYAIRERTDLSSTVISFGEAISGAFMWDRTPEGFDYWEKIVGYYESFNRIRDAAPELLEALENIENDDGHIPEKIWAMRNAAIAKAKGK